MAEKWKFDVDMAMAQKIHDLFDAVNKALIEAAKMGMKVEIDCTEISVSHPDYHGRYISFQNFRVDVFSAVEVKRE